MDQVRKGWQRYFRKSWKIDTNLKRGAKTCASHLAHFPPFSLTLTLGALILTLGALILTLGALIPTLGALSSRSHLFMNDSAATTIHLVYTLSTLATFHVEL